MTGTNARVGAFAAAAALILTISACSSAGPNDSTGSTAARNSTGSSASSSSTNATDAGVTYASAAVAKARQAATGFTAPGGAIPNVASLKGKTVYYIPVALQVPFFQGAIQGLKDALSPLGITLRTCDGGGSPAAISTCLNQAVTSGTGAVITDSVALDFAQHAFDNVTAHKIPLLFMNEPTTAQNDSLASVGGDAGKIYTTLTADWIIAHSNGKAKVLVVEITDSQASEDFIEKGGLAEFSNHCPGCTVTVVKTTTSQLQNLASLVSSTLVKHPDINYLFPEFDVDVAAAVQGLQTGSASNNVTVASTTGLLSSLQLVEKKQHQLEDTGENEYAEAWNAADAVLRMMLKQPVPSSYPLPIRVFDSENIDTLTLTPAAANSGQWYGNGNFRSVYQKLWG